MKSNRFGAWRPASRASVAFLAVVVTLPGWAAGVLGAQNQRATGRAALPPRSALKIKGLKARVEVDRDTYGIPHIYAASTEDAYFALGYLHATDRPLEMELFRRRASGTLAEVFGRALLDDDVFIRQVGIRRGAEAVWRSPRLNEYQGGRVRREVEAYCAGVNARFQEVGTAKLAEMFRPLGIVPAPWTPVDALAFPRYMGWDQSGTDTDVWMGMLVEKLGLAAVDELFPLDRPYEISTVPADQSVRPHWSAEDVPRLPADFDTAALELHRHFVSGRFGSEFALGSNNWAVDGTKSSTGKPLLANDPHLGFQLPSIWYAAHLVAPGLNITGVTFAGFPYTIIGHNDRIAWGLTNMQADAVDYFIEKTDPARPHQYLYHGAWRETSRREEDVPVRGEAPVHLEVESTVHGPLVTTHGAKLALEWTGLEPSFEVIAFARLNTARNLEDYKAALGDLKVPALNVIYADVDGNIAIAPHGALPIRKRGLGRWPVDGSSGDYDWAGMIPDDQLPFSLNPRQHYLASANGRPASVGYPYYLGWMWDPSYRTRRIHELLSTHDHIALAQMEAFQMDTHDSAAESFVPALIRAYDRKPFGDAVVRRAIDELRRWDFNATPESAAPAIWSTWFELYRAAVWQNHFDAAGVEPWPGGWGYAGSNERQPELEVLEFLTRTNPTSTWFDDVRTPEKETRDDVMARSFVQAVAQLVNERGENFADWRWGKTNVLRLHSITQQRALDRGGEPVGGDEFTLSPGDNGHDVTGGASWRMVVDLAHLERSAGMYPGGQSEDPSDPHYNDQTKAWTTGRYLPLYFYAKPQEFKPRELESVLVLQPE